MDTNHSKKRGFALVELLVIIGVFLILSTISFRMIVTIKQKSRFVGAKMQISQIAVLLEQMHEDTGYYPVFLSDLLRTSPPPGQERGWKGPYITTLPADPWGNGYFYEIPPTTFFNSPSIYRTTPPSPFFFTIDSPPGPGTLVVTNYQVTACDVYLNGVLIIPDSEFKNAPVPQIIQKAVTLLAVNTLRVFPRSNPSSTLSVAVSGLAPITTYYILGSYGNDGKAGGAGWNKDARWTSNKFPNFE